MKIQRSTLNASLHGLTAVGVSLLLAACQSAPTPAPPAAKPAARGAAPAVLNDLCPITGDAVDPKFTVAYQGRKIAFCCEHCFREFRESDDAGKAAIAAKLTPPPK